MKTTKFLLTIAALLTAVSAHAVNLSVQNLNNAGNGAYGLFDNTGTLLSSSITGNLRVGAFNSGFDAQSAWDSGDLASLNTNFNQFSTNFSLNDFGGGFNGLFQDALDQTVSATLDEEAIVFWAYKGVSFTDVSSEHFIYTFNASFPVEPAGAPITLILGESAGSIIAGAQGNFSNDYGIGGGSLPGFNTVNVVPEPSTYAALVGMLALGFATLRRRR
jgi:hypothetical protein